MKAIYLMLLTFKKQERKNFSRNKKCNSSPPPRQHICPDISSEDERNSEFRNDKNIQGKLDVLVEQKHLNNRRASA